MAPSGSVLDDVNVLIENKNLHELNTLFETILARINSRKFLSVRESLALVDKTYNRNKFAEAYLPVEQLNNNNNKQK